MVARGVASGEKGEMGKASTRRRLERRGAYLSRIAREHAVARDGAPVALAIFLEADQKALVLLLRPRRSSLACLLLAGPAAATRLFGSRAAATRRAVLDAASEARELLAGGEIRRDSDPLSSWYHGEQT